MKTMKLLLPITIFYSGLFAVINTFEDSYSRINNINTPFESINMPGVDIDALIREDEKNTGIGVPMRFAHSFNVDLGINTKMNQEFAVSLDLNDTLKTDLQVIIARINAQAANIFLINEKKKKFEINDFIKKNKDYKKKYIIAESKKKMRAINAAWDQIQKLKS